EREQVCASQCVLSNAYSSYTTCVFAGIFPLSLHGALPFSERWALEPVLGAEALQLLGPEGGSGYAYTAGLNLLFLDSFKAMLQGEHALRPGDSRPAFALFFQLAAQLSLE